MQHKHTQHEEERGNNLLKVMQKDATKKLKVT